MYARVMHIKKWGILSPVVIWYQFCRQVLHQAAIDAECLKPELISTTRMRKYTATVLQVTLYINGRKECVKRQLYLHSN